MNRYWRSLPCLLTLSALALFATDAMAKPNSKQQPAKKIQEAKKPQAAKEARPHRSAKVEKRRHAKHADAKKKSKQAKDAPAPKEAAPPLTGDLALVKEAIDLARKAKTDEATATRDRIADPAAQKLVEWFILRHPETTAGFSRYAAFLAANPEWPSAAQLRRRAEARLWQERGDAAKVRGFTGGQPVSARGKLALARVKLNEGDREGAGRLVRDAWRSDELSERVEAEVLEMSRDLLTPYDHRARMDKRIGAKDLAGARRAAKLLGDDGLAIVKACAAVRGKSDSARSALDEVTPEARADLGYTLCRMQWMLAQNRIDDAAREVLAASGDTMAEQETDQWWRERRT
ncbi:MAG: lytic transglycosylase domain-containing protein, partial [Bradyrhizobium sp.]